MRPEEPLSSLFRLTPVQSAALKRLGIGSIRDLLYHFPSRYEQGGTESTISGLVGGSSATIFGTLTKLETRRSWKRRIPVGQARLSDGSGSITVMWFHQPYLAKKFAEGQFVRAVGTVGGKDGKLYFANPEVSVADPVEAGLFRSTSAQEAGAYFAVYPESRGITSLWFRHAIARALQEKVLEQLEDPLPIEMRERYRLPDLPSAMRYIHTPEVLAHAEAARKRFAFEEIFAIQVARAEERADNDRMSALVVGDAHALAKRFLSSAAVRPTGAQERAIREILVDLAQGQPMARLLEGDVGSGKTLVAAAVAYAVVNSRPPGRSSGTLQVAYMAPTEILAQQHFSSFIEYFRELPISIALITGSGCKKFPSKVTAGRATDISRSQLLKWVGNGEVAMVVGTHALIQKSVKFQHLALAIVDEQHRFGVRQRRSLAQKNDLALPHFLSMTATPIPRTLALTIYGDLDLSVLDELPPGRAKIGTHIVKKAGRAAAYERMRAQLRKGRQAFVICPRINEPDPQNENALLAKSAKAEAARLKKEVFPEFRIGLLHGAMRPKEKETVMKAFAAGDIDILVATSVVEVGVNVPNATVIAIEGAERFGLAQLHQLRGRVMRSSHPPLCFLFADGASDLSQKRLRALEESADGFSLAEKDLALRGAGDIYGRSQWGVSDLGMEALKNVKLIAAARDEARSLVARDPALEEYPALRERAAIIAAQLHAE